MQKYEQFLKIDLEWSCNFLSGFEISKYQNFVFLFTKRYFYNSYNVSKYLNSFLIKNSIFRIDSHILWLILCIRYYIVRYEEVHVITVRHNWRCLYSWLDIDNAFDDCVFRDSLSFRSCYFATINNRNDGRITFIKFVYRQHVFGG